MTTFDNREKAFEAEYQLREEQDFKICARRDKLFARWLGERIGLSALDLEEYVKDMVLTDMQEPGDEDIVRKSLKDCQDHGLGLTEHEIRQKLSGFKAQAADQIKAEMR